MTSSNICRPKSSIYFHSFTDNDLSDTPKGWRPPVQDFAEVCPDSLYLVYPDGTTMSYKTATAVKFGVLSLPDCKTDFTEDSPCVKALISHGKYRVCVHAKMCYVYTPAKFKKLLEQAGRMSLDKQLAYFKSLLSEARDKEKLTETLVEQFSRGLE